MQQYQSTRLLKVRCAIEKMQMCFNTGCDNKQASRLMHYQYLISNYDVSDQQI